MTPPQKQLYWRAWHRAAGALGCRGKGAVIDRSRLSEKGRRAVEIADQMAERIGRVASAETVRHASHFVALGRFKSSKALSNADFDRVLIVFRLIADGDDLSAMIAWADHEQGERTRLTWSIQDTAPEPLILKLCRDKFARSDWCNLAAPQLRQLLMTVKRIAQRAELREAAVG